MGFTFSVIQSSLQALETGKSVILLEDKVVHVVNAYRELWCLYVACDLQRPLDSDHLTYRISLLPTSLIFSPIGLVSYDYF